jgi:DHA3 family macrolide efflux protein-like MFS transporter
MHFLRLLRQRHLALLWGSQVLSAMGDNLYDIAVLWTAVRVAGGGAGLVAAAGTAARFLCGMLGGVYADRWDRRATLIGVDLLRAIVVLVPLPLVMSGQLRLWQLALVAVAVNALGTLFDPALQASLPALVGDREALGAVNGLMDGTRRLARSLGPSCAGLLVAVLPLAQFFTLNAASYLVSAGAVAAIGRHFAPRVRDRVLGPGGPRGIAQEIAGAIGLVRGHRALAYGIGANAVSNVAWSAAFTVGAPLLADRVLGGGVGVYGLIVGAYGAGNIIGNLVVGSLPIRRPLLLLTWGRVVLGLGFLVVAFAHSVPVALVGTAFAALGGPMGDIVLLTLMQRDLPQAQIGKVYALRLTTATAGMSLGLVVAGPLYALCPVPVAIALCAAVMLATGLAGLVRFSAGTSGEVEAAMPLPLPAGLPDSSGDTRRP